MWQCSLSLDMRCRYMYLLTIGQHTTQAFDRDCIEVWVELAFVPVTTIAVFTLSRDEKRISNGWLSDGRHKFTYHHNMLTKHKIFDGEFHGKHLLWCHIMIVLRRDERLFSLAALGSDPKLGIELWEADALLIGIYGCSVILQVTTW